MLLRIFKTLIWGYALFLLALTIRRYFNFSSEVVDLGFYHSVLIQLSSFQIPRIWEQSIYVWADHFEPILFFFAPIYWLIKDAGVIFALQAVITISGAIPLYLLAKFKTKSESLAAALAFSYLAFDGLQFGYAYGFHPIMFFPTIFFWFVYFLEKQNKKLLWIFFFLTLMVKEEASLILSFYALYLIFFKNLKDAGFKMLFISSFWAFMCFGVIFPYFSAGAGFRHLGQYGLVKTLGPLALIIPISKIATMVHTFGAFSFLPFFYPPSLLIIIPSFMEKFLSNNIASLNGFHYSAAIAGVILVASIDSLAKHQSLLESKIVPLLIIVMAMVENIFYGYAPLSLVNFSPRMFIQTSHEKLLNQVIADIPQTASVSAQYIIAPHFIRPYDRLHTTGNLPENSDYVVLDSKTAGALTTPERDKKYLKAIFSDPRYKLVFNKDGIKVFRKIY